MRTRIALMACLGGLLTGATSTSAIGADKVAHDKNHWDCFTAQGAQSRREQVERGLLPQVVFVGEENQPSEVAARLTAHNAPAMSVAVIRAGKLDWSAAWSQRDAGTRVGCDSLFQAGSIAKPATLLAALRMKQKGVIDFDADIETYFSSYHLPAGRQSADNPVTFRNLFAHVSGITPGGYIGYSRNQPMPTDAQTVRAETPANARKVEVQTPPSSGLAYSGGGYTVAEIALQDRLRKPFEQIMREWLIKPVGMKQADFTVPLPASSESRVAHGHLADGSEVPGGWNNYPEQAAAGLWATASDLATLLIEMRRGQEGKSKLFTQASIRELLAKPIEGHVFGFRLVGDGDQVFITHYGGTVGYRAGMTMNMRSGDGAVFLSNSDNGADVGAEFLASVARTYGWPTFRETQVTRVSQTAQVLQALAGRYQFGDGPTITVSHENERLAVLFPNGDRYEMTPIKGLPREFIHASTGVRISFDGEGAETTIQLYGQTGRRLPSGK